MTAGTSTTGTIYDLGYRRYDGPRLGRAHAIRSMYVHSLRTAFGVGRGGRSKIAPVILGIIALLPAVAMTAALTIFARFGGADQIPIEQPIRYDTYAGSIGTIVILFCAAQAPELFGRDQRHGVLSLYFARALRRTDYVLARMGGFVTAIFLLELVPQIVLFVGRVLLSTDIPKAVGDDLPKVGPVLAEAALSAGLLGGLSMTVSALTPRRAYAVAGIIALFLIPNIVSGIMLNLGSELGVWLTFLSPTALLDHANAFLFDKPFMWDGIIPDVPDVAFVAAAVVGIAGSIAVSIRRLSRIGA